MAGTGPAMTNAKIRDAKATGTMVQLTLPKNSRISEGNFNVVFASDVSNCAFTATVSTVSDGGTASLAAGSSTTIRVETRSGGGPDGTSPTPPTDRPFNLIAVC